MLKKYIRASILVVAVAAICILIAICVRQNNPDSKVNAEESVFTMPMDDVVVDEHGSMMYNPPTTPTKVGEVTIWVD